MPIIQNNNFTLDSYAMRAERLSAIQGNFASIQPELNAPENIVTWTEDCYDVFMDLWSKSDVAANEKQSSTLDSDNKCTVMEEAYQAARGLAITLYHNDPVNLKEFDFNELFPVDRFHKIVIVKNVLDTNAKHIAKGVTHVIPATIITRLTNALEDFEESLKVQKNCKDLAIHATADLTRLYDDDSLMLQSLKAWWFAMLGKKDERITIIGMVNPQSGSGGTKFPAAPTNLRFSLEHLRLTWDSVTNATSYQLEADLGEGFEEIYSGEEVTFDYTPQNGKTLYRVRARNSNGYGDYSPVLEQYYYDVLPAPGDITIDEVSLNTFHFYWDAVPTATKYKLYQSVVEVGQPEEFYTVLATVETLQYDGTFPPNKWIYFKLTCLNEYQPESGFSRRNMVETSSEGE